VRHTPDALYQAFELLIHWELAECDVARTHSFVPPRRVYYHTRPLLRRADVSLEREIHSPPLPTEQLSRAEGRAFLDFAVASSAARYRELYGFTYGDPARIVRADAGRGLEIYFWGIPPARRLPLRAYHDGMMFKNGVPTGYVEILSLFERAEVGFNLYYTFREGESAWIFARVLRLCRQLLGVECFSVDPYQLGWENPEGIESGAFWFYRKLGFRPVRAEAARLAALEERKIAAQPGYRTPARTLRRLAAGPAIYAETADWDAFSVRAIGLKYPFASLEALVRRFSARWPAGDRRAAEAVVRAKSAPDESRYLRLMQAHPRLRAAFLNQPETRSASGAPGR
jgi:hypothetical protein